MKDKKDRRLEFLSLVPSSAKRILDVGCGHGFLSGHLVKEGKEVVGVDRDAKVCDIARGRLTDVHHFDLETFIPPYPKESFDCIIFADVDWLLRAFNSNVRIFYLNQDIVYYNYQGISYHKGADRAWEKIKIFLKHCSIPEFLIYMNFAIWRKLCGR